VECQWCPPPLPVPPADPVPVSPADAVPVPPIEPVPVPALLLPAELPVPPAEPVPVPAVPLPVPAPPPAALLPVLEHLRPHCPWFPPRRCPRPRAKMSRLIGLEGEIILC